MAQIFYVHCPACGGRFPCHQELWQVEYDLLCPYCGLSFPQDQSPLIISASGERRERAPQPADATTTGATSAPESM